MRQTNYVLKDGIPVPEPDRSKCPDGPIQQPDPQTTHPKRGPGVNPFGGHPPHPIGGHKRSSDQSSSLNGEAMPSWKADLERLKKELKP